MVIGRGAAAGLLLGLAIAFVSASAADDTTCPPLRGVVLHPKPSDHGFTLTIGIAGSNRTFLLDLGHAYSKLDEKVATELKLPFKRAPFVVKDGKSSFEKTVTVPTIRLGAVERGESTILAGPPAENWGAVDGIAGMNMFAGFDVELDLAHNRIGLYLPRDCKFQPFWPADVFGVADLKAEPTGRIVLPMELDGVRIEADMRMRGPRSKMARAAARALFQDFDANRLSQVEKTEDGDTLFHYPFRRLVAGERVTVENPQIFVTDGDDEMCSGVAGRINWEHQNKCFGGGDVGLGLDLLKKLHLYFMYENKKVYFTAAEPPSEISPPVTKQP
jgi:hypothetical protein